MGLKVKKDTIFLISRIDIYFKIFLITFSQL